MNDIDGSYKYNRTKISNVAMCQRHQDQIATLLTTIKGEDVIMDMDIYSLARVAYIEFNKTNVELVVELDDVDFNTKPVSLNDIQDYNNLIENRYCNGKTDADLQIPERECNHNNISSMVHEAISMALSQFDDANSDGLFREKFIIIFTECPILNQTQRREICMDFESAVNGSFNNTASQLAYDDKVTFIMINNGFGM